jgi:hypothetical protein
MLSDHQNVTQMQQKNGYPLLRRGAGLSLMVRRADRDCVIPFRPPAATKQLGGSGEAIFTARRRRPETEMPHKRPRSNNEVRSCCHSSSAFVTAGLARNIWPGCDMRACKAAEAFDRICALTPAAIFMVERSPSRLYLDLKVNRRACTP